MKITDYHLHKEREKMVKREFYNQSLTIFLLTIPALMIIAYLPFAHPKLKKLNIGIGVFGSVTSLIAMGLNKTQFLLAERDLERINKINENHSRYWSAKTDIELQEYYSPEDSVEQHSEPSEDDLINGLLKSLNLDDSKPENQKVEQAQEINTVNIIPQEISFSQPTTIQSSFSGANTVLMPQRQPINSGLDIIEQAAATSLSTVFSSPPGTGKTVTLLAWLKCVLTKFPDSFITVVAQKNDRFLGLNTIGAVSIFDGIDTSTISEAINETFNILSFRKNQDEQTREQFRRQPIWLILDDWFSMFEVLKKNKKIWDDLSAKIATIVTVGRDSNVAIAVTTHSFNIASLGLAGDSNIRSCLNIMSLGFISKDEFGRNQGGFDAINSILNNNSIIPKEYKDNLRLELEKLISESNRQQTPILFTTMGHPPRMSLVPNLCEIKQSQISQDILISIKQKLDYIRGNGNNTISTVSTQEEIQETQSSQSFSGSGEEIYDEVEREEKRAKITELLSQGFGKMQIIQSLWAVSGGRAYQKACQEYNKLMEDS